MNNIKRFKRIRLGFWDFNFNIQARRLTRGRYRAPTKQSLELVMKTVDKNLIDTLEGKFEEQKTIAGTLDYHDGPVDMQGVYSFSTKIIDRIFEGRFANKISQTGSWISDQSIPFQLLEHKHLTVDLKIEELKKEKPYNIPIDSLCFLARDGFLYLNLRDYESEEEKGFKNLGIGNCAKNLNEILSRAPDQIYFGSALREPLFNAGLQWNGKTETKINDIQGNYYRELETSYKAYKLELDKNGIKTDNTIFRGEEQNLMAASWHYAFLSSFKSQIPDIFSDQNKNNLSPTVHGIETKKNKAIESANNWLKKKNSSGFRRKAALDFLDLAGHLRTLHQIYTAPITASWGTNYNMTSTEFIRARKHRSSILAGRDISENNELKRFIYWSQSRV